MVHGRVHCCNNFPNDPPEHGRASAVLVGRVGANSVFIHQPFVYPLLGRLEYGEPQQHVLTLKFFPSSLVRLRAEGVVVYMALLTRC